MAITLNQIKTSTCLDGYIVMLWAGRSYKNQLQVNVSQEQAIKITDMLEYGITPSKYFMQKIRIKKIQKLTISKIEVLHREGMGYIGMASWKSGKNVEYEIYDIPTSIALSLTFKRPLIIQKSILAYFKASEDEVKYHISFALEHLHWPEIWNNIFKNLSKMAVDTLNRLMEVSLRDEDFKAAALLRDEFLRREKIEYTPKK